jgi:hypothetical protein
LSSFYYHSLVGFLLILLSTFSIESLAQPDDTRLRSQVGLQYKPVKRLNLKAMYRYDLEQNLTSFRRSNFELGGEYRFLNWLELGAFYRFGTSFEEDFHRLELALQFRQKIFDDKVRLSWKTSALLVSPYLNREYLRFNDPLWVLRNKLKVQYNLSKRINVFAYTELFASSRSVEMQFFRLRTGMGGSYTFKKQHEFSLEYFYQNEFNRKDPRTVQVFEVGYNYEFRKRKKKKK